MSGEQGNTLPYDSVVLEAIDDIDASVYYRMLEIFNTRVLKFN